MSFPVQIRHFESDEKSNSLRKEYLALEKAQQGLKKDADALREELDIASLDPKEANAKFTARVNDFKAGAKRMEEKASQVHMYTKYHQTERLTTLYLDLTCHACLAIARLF